MKKFLSFGLIILLALNVVSAIPVYAWNMPVDTPPVIDDPAYMFPAFTNGERLLEKKETNDLPAMGWNSWHAYGSSITEQNIKATADAFVRLGLKDVGYDYVVMDDGCYPTKRGDDDRLSNNSKFPSGFKALSDYIHERDLKFGMYNDVGLLTCAGQAGLFGKEDLDAQSFAEWGVDYLKVDFCYYPWDNATFSAGGNVRYSTAPRVRGITLSNDSGFSRELNAVRDGTIFGKASKNSSGNYVNNINVADVSYDPIHWGELIFDVNVETAGTYNLTVEYSGGTENGRWLQVAVGPKESETRYFDNLLDATADYNTYAHSPNIPIKLSAGENKIRLMNYRRQENALQSYASFYDGLRKAGVADDFKLSVCEWGKTAPYAWAHKVGDSWRTANDITFSVGKSGKARWTSDGQDSIIGQYNRAVVLDEYAGLDKGWNDPDMMVVGMIDSTSTNNERFTQKVDISHFTLWCMLNSPIMLGIDLASIQVGDPVHEVITNKDAIALNQDPLGIQAKRIYTSARNGDPTVLNTSAAGRIDVLAKPLANGDFALTFLNTGDKGTADQTATVDINLILEKIGHKMADRSAVEDAGLFLVKDIWSKETSFINDGIFSATVTSQETKTIRVTPIVNAMTSLEATDNGTIIAKYILTNDTDKTINARLLLAEYNASGLLKTVKDKQVSVSDSMYIDEIEMDVPAESGGTVKAFIWGEGNYEPLCNFAEYSFPELKQAMGQIKPLDVDIESAGTVYEGGPSWGMNPNATMLSDTSEKFRCGWFWKGSNPFANLRDKSLLTGPIRATRYPDMVGHWAEKYVNALADKGITIGMKDGLFHPDLPVTTSQFVKMILVSRFGEIRSTDGYWASGYLNLAFDKGIIPDVNISDAEEPLPRRTAAGIGHEALLNIFDEDDEADTSVAEELDDLYSCRTCVMHIAQLYTKGIMLGKSDGLFHGEDSLTRAEASAVIMKMIDPSLRDLPTVTTPSPGASEDVTISPENVKDIMKSDKTALLIDVRSQEEHNTGYIPGSICVSLSDLTENLSGTVITPNKDTVIIVYCQKGSRSIKALNILKEAGYSKVFNLGGIEDWPYEIISPDRP